jgi:hypothetical protein
LARYHSTGGAGTDENLSERAGSCYGTRMGRTGWESAALGIWLMAVSAAATPAHAQSLAPPPTAALRHASVPTMPSLRLTWPVAPLQFSFSQMELKGYASGPLQLFRAESLWLQTPAFRLLTTSSAERAFELDCRLTCQPILKREVELEARVPLPRFSQAVGDSYAFVRSSAFATSQRARFSRQLGAGVGGFLSF